MKNKWWENRTDITKFKKESDRVCHYCGKQIANKEDLTVDHVIPISKGGENSTDNFVIACKACNREKANLNVERYSEFLNIVKIMGESAGVLESIENVINSLKEIVISFNGDLYAMKNNLSKLEKKRNAILNSLMYKKFNVVQGFDHAKQLRDITEEIYELKLNISQMNRIQNSIKAISPFLNSANAKGIKKEAMHDVRNEIIMNYRAFASDDDTDEEAAVEVADSDSVSAEEQTG